MPVWQALGGRDGRLVELDGELVGASLHDVAVVEAAGGYGVGALVTAGCGAASDQGCARICRISTAMGESVYRRVGFQEVARIAYWYRGKG